MDPTQIGPYRIESCLNKSTWSALYLAKDAENSLVVVKALSERMHDHKEALARFQREAHILQKVSHPYIVKILQSGIFQGAPYIAMEFVEGASLRDWILYRPLSLSQAVHLILDIAYAICHLHTHGVVHRDLKPENILLTNDRLPKLLDFGIAQLLADPSLSPSSEEPAIMGTPVYMSPEQRDHPQYVSYSSDLYSLGIIAYEIILGRLSHGHIYLALMPKGIQKILRKMLQPNVLDRYPDVVDLIVDLSSYLNGPQFLEESHGIQPLYPFWEQLQHLQQSLVPTQLPQSDRSGSAISCRDRTTTWGVYIDRLEISSNEKTRGEFFLVAESCRTGAEGVMAAGALRARMHSLYHQPKEIKEQLYELQQSMMREGNIDGLFFLNGLYLSEERQCVEAFSYGAGGIWWIEEGEVFSIEGLEVERKAEESNPLFGAAEAKIAKSLEKPYNPKRRWVIHTRYVVGQPDSKEGCKEEFMYTPLTWRKKLLETAAFSPQGQASALMQLSPRQTLVNIHTPLQACFVLQEHQLR